MLNIYLVRHTKYVDLKGVSPFRMPGVSLSQEGKNQANEIGKFFVDKNISRIFASPMERTFETAEIISSHVNANIDPDFRLLEVGSPFQGLTMDKQDEIMQEDNLYFNDRHVDFGGERHEENLKRMKLFIDEKLKEFENDNIIVISHGHPLMILYMEEKGIKIDRNQKIREQMKDYIPWAGIIEMNYHNQKLVKTINHYQFVNDD